MEPTNICLDIHVSVLNLRLHVELKQFINRPNNKRRLTMQSTPLFNMFFYIKKRNRAKIMHSSFYNAFYYSSK